MGKMFTTFFHTEITHLLSMPGLRQLPTLPNGSSATGHFPLVQESERCINSKDNTRNSSSTKSHTASLIYNVFNKTLLETEQQMEKKIIQKIEKKYTQEAFHFNATKCHSRTHIISAYINSNKYTCMYVQCTQ